jgi:hypothetical protein
VVNRKFGGELVWKWWGVSGEDERLNRFNKAARCERSPSLLDKEIKRGQRTYGLRTCRLDKQTPQAQIPNLGDFVTSITAPKD